MGPQAWACGLHGACSRFLAHSLGPLRGWACGMGWACAFIMFAPIRGIVVMLECNGPAAKSHCSRTGAMHTLNRSPTVCISVLLCRTYTVDRTLFWCAFILRGLLGPLVVLALNHVTLAWDIMTGWACASYLWGPSIGIDYIRMDEAPKGTSILNKVDL